MVRPLIFALIVFILVALIGMWVLGGGPRRTVERITSIDFTDSFDPSDGAAFRLPWQPAELFPPLDLSAALTHSVAIDSNELLSEENELATLEAEYARLERDASHLRTFGTPSPFTGMVSIMGDHNGIRESEPNQEYIELVANYSASGSIDLTGWYLESALSRTRIPIPFAASPFISGSTNTVVPIALASGDRVMIISGSSPVGISFRENICTGYLEQFQSFGLPLERECPIPSSILPLTEENLRTYGDACFDILASLNQCEFPQNLPDTLWPSCRTFLANTFSYNGCISRERNRASFNKDVWRVFLNAGEQWRNSHDAIRLLDAQGRTVDVFVY